MAETAPCLGRCRSRGAVLSFQLFERSSRGLKQRLRLEAVKAQLISAPSVHPISPPSAPTSAPPRNAVAHSLPAWLKAVESREEFDYDDLINRPPSPGPLFPSSPSAALVDAVYAALTAATAGSANVVDGYAVDDLIVHLICEYLPSAPLHLIVRRSHRHPDQGAPCEGLSHEELHPTLLHHRLLSITKQVRVHQLPSPSTAWFHLYGSAKRLDLTQAGREEEEAKAEIWGERVVEMERRGIEVYETAYVPKVQDWDALAREKENRRLGVVEEIVEDEEMEAQDEAAEADEDGRDNAMQ